VRFGELWSTDRSLEPREEANGQDERYRGPDEGNGANAFPVGLGKHENYHESDER